MPNSLDSFDNNDGFGYSSPKLSEPKFDIGPYTAQNREGASSGNSFGGEKFRGSSELPLTSQGLMKAHMLGQQLARKGGLDRIMTSSLGRTLQTAKIVSHYTHAPIVHIGDELHPWHQGALEGTEVNQDSVNYLNHLIKEAPDEKVPGRGPLSTADGESFNDFHNRAMPFLQKVMADSRARPQEKIGLVTHYRVKKLLDAWMRNGSQSDGSIDRNEMALHTGSGKPGSIERLTIDPYAGPQMSSIDLQSPGQLGGGIYLLRHEATPWNANPPSGQGT